MVHEITNSKYGVLIETFIIALAVLLLGFLLGFFVESYRTGRVIDSYKDFEVTSLDLKLQNYYYQIMSTASCDKAVEQNLIFADDIYDAGLILEKYEEANELSDDLLLEKKKYVLLKTELWLNSILLKERCGDSFDTVVYVYSQYSGAVKEIEQDTISNILKELKEEKENKIILIPIAGDLDLDIVDLQLRVYNITYLPSLIISEEHVLEGYQSKESIEKYL